MRELGGAEKDLFISLLLSMGMDGSVSPESLSYLDESGWKLATIPDGTDLGKSAFADLAAVVKACGDEEMVIANTFSPMPNQHLVACALDYYEFKQALASNDDFRIFDTAIVGRSKRWVAILKGALGIGFLAADPQVMKDGDLFGPGLRH